MDLSIHTAELVKFLREEETGFSLCEQLLACGTKAGFCCSKLADEQERVKAQEQIREELYILEIAVRAGYLSERQSIPIKKECTDILLRLEEMESISNEGGNENETEG